MTDERPLPNLPPEAIVKIGQVQLCIEGLIRELDESVDLEEDDRAIVIVLLSLAYVQGWEDRSDGKSLDSSS